MSTTEHSLLIALRELDGLETQRRDQEAAEAAARAAAEARVRHDIEARARADADARAAAEAARLAAEAAERERREHALRLRAAEAEARIRGEQAARLHLVEAEIDAQLRVKGRQETMRQRLAAAALLGVLGLVGAIGATLMTRTKAPTVVAVGASDHLAALREYADVVEGMKRDVSRLRDENARNNALLDAAALAPIPSPAAPAAVVKPRPIKPKPAVDPIKKPRVTICHTDDPLAEDCDEDKKK
jgi:hypothetical protein